MSVVVLGYGPTGCDLTSHGTDGGPVMRRRRGNGEGSIYQRKDGRWCATMNMGYNGEGKRVRRTIYGSTKKQVQEKLVRLQTQKLDGTLGEPTKLTVTQFLDRWLEDSAKPTIRESTYENYRLMIRLHIVPYIGGVVLSKLTPAHVQGMQSRILNTGVSPRTCQLARQILHRAIEQGVKWGMVPRNVCDAVDPPRVPKRPMKTFTPEQAFRFLKEAEQDRLSAMYVLAISAGLRMGELLAIQWQDIDFDAGTLSVQRGLVEVNGRQLIQEPKTAKGRRMVDLPRFAVDALLEHRKRTLAEGHARIPWVFCTKGGELLRKNNVRSSSYMGILKRANQKFTEQAEKKGVIPELLPIIRFHDLRHTAATIMLSQGVHPKIVQERLGHSTISMTLDTYSHVLPTMQKEAVEKLDRLYRTVGA